MIAHTNIVIWAEESYMWNHAGVVGPPEKLIIPKLLSELIHAIMCQ